MTSHGSRAVPVLERLPLLVCEIALQEGETVNQVALGDSIPWLSDQMLSGDASAPTPHVIVKPTEHDLLYPPPAPHSPYAPFLARGATTKGARVTGWRPSRGSLAVPETPPPFESARLALLSLADAPDYGLIGRNLMSAPALQPSPSGFRAPRWPASTRPSRSWKPWPSSSRAGHQHADGKDGPLPPPDHGGRPRYPEHRFEAARRVERVLSDTGISLRVASAKFQGLAGPLVSEIGYFARLYNLPRSVDYSVQLLQEILILRSPTHPSGYMPPLSI